MRGASARLAFSRMLALSGLLGVTPARAHGSFPEPQQILLPPDRPAQIILVTNFGLIFSEDGGQTWLFSCEQALSAYAGPYLLGAQPSHRILAMTSGDGLIYSDDDSCTWRAASGTLTDVLPYAFAVDPSNAKRVYVIGAPRKNLQAGDGIYISDDGGVTFGKPVFTAPPSSAVLSVLGAPSRPGTMFATMFSTPENHPFLLRSHDSGEHWEVAADLVGSLGENPFALLAIDPIDENKLYVRVLGASAEMLAISNDAGKSFVQSVSIPGTLNAFLKLESGTILVGGTAGANGVGYRSKDGAQSFEPWPEAPRVHALAERNGKLYVAADNFSDGYAIAESDDEGAHLRPLAGFKQVQAVKSCVAELCRESCAYYAGVLWQETVCGAESNLADAGADTKDADSDEPGEPKANATADGEPPSADSSDEHPSFRASGGGCACNLGYHRPDGWRIMVLGSMLVVGWRRRRGLKRVLAIAVALAANTSLSACSSNPTEQKTTGGSGSTGQAGAVTGQAGEAAGQAGSDGAPIDDGGGDPTREDGAGGARARDSSSDAVSAGAVTFVKVRLNPDFYSEGINYGDLNRDGKADIIAGPYWYPGPDFTSKVPFRQPRATPFDIGGDSDCYLIFVYDLNQDGWPDILSFRLPGGAEAVWYENPKGAAGNWTEHLAFSASHDESPAFTDIDGDGKPEIVTISNGFGGWVKPNWASPQALWTFVPVTAKGPWGQYTHGLGVGDVNGDGRRDLILPEGWWEQPLMPSATAWPSHPAMLWGQELPTEGYGGAQMFVDDVDGDGDRDIVTSLQAHGWGLAWFENQGGGFIKHMIMNTRVQEAQYGVAFAQLHAMDLADLDGDGLLDIVTGKRKGAHGNGLGAELDAPAVLYWFKLVRQAGQLPHYEAHLIDSQAGVGTQVTVADVNGDGLPDILTAGRAGAFVFLHQ
jgi:hypothetical protein